jgi:CRP-like cAMP-binding protein
MQHAQNVAEEISSLPNITPEALQQIRALFQKLPIFQSLPSADLDALARVAHKCLYSPDDANRGLIFSDGDHSDTLYIVVSGKVAFSVTNAVGTRIELTPAEEGSFFGEVALLTDTRRTATARAASPTVALEIRWNDLLPLLRTHPEILLAMYRETAVRLANTSVKLRQTTIRNPNDLIQEKMTKKDERLHKLARFCGSLALAFWTTIVTVVWIGALCLLGKPALDGPAFNLLALLIPLEGIIISCVVLHGEYRQAERDRIRNDAETEANLNAQQEILNLNEKVDALAAELRNRLPEPGHAVAHHPSEKSPAR